MDSLGFIYILSIVMIALTALLVLVTVLVKALRALRQAWYRSHYRRIEPALERYLITGEEQPELRGLSRWQKDRFLSELMVERLVLLRGSGHAFLSKLAEDLGLVDRYLSHLSSRNKWKRARAAERLGYFGGERAVEPLGRMLPDEDETVRAVAARALARLGTDRAVELLIGTLDSPSELTRLRVAENLERIGRPAVGPLVAALEKVDRLGARQLHGPIMAARVLGNLRASEARGVLRKALRHGKQADVRAQAALALGKTGDPEDVPALLRASKDNAWPVRAQAANALGMIGEVSAIGRLKELASDDAWWVRVNSCKALSNMGPEGEKALLEILAGEDPYARDRAAATLESQGVTRRMVRSLNKPGRRGERARAVVETLVRSGATRHLRAILEDLPEGEERRILAGMLGEEAPEAARVGAEEDARERPA